MGGGYSQEESFRMKIWMENKAKIEKHNRHFYKVMNYLFSYGWWSHLSIFITGSSHVQPSYE